MKRGWENSNSSAWRRLRQEALYKEIEYLNLIILMKMLIKKPKLEVLQKIICPLGSGIAHFT